MFDGVEESEEGIWPRGSYALRLQRILYVLFSYGGKDGEMLDRL
jgi:hypothetical protein